MSKPKYSWPTDILLNEILPMVQGNCESYTSEGTKCNNPWQFKIGDKVGSCRKYCVNHCDKWVDRLFENPYIVIGKEEKTGKEVVYETNLRYEFVDIKIPMNVAKSLISRNIKNGYIDIQINPDDSSWNISFLNNRNGVEEKIIQTIEEFKIFLCNVLQYDITHIVKTIWSTNPDSGNDWITELPVINPQIINKITGQKSMKWNLGTGQKFIYDKDVKIYSKELDENEDVVY